VQARFWLGYIQSDGNLSGSAKRAGVSRDTAYKWLNDWQPNGGPPDDVLKALQDDTDDWLHEAESARLEAVRALRKLMRTPDNFEGVKLKNLAIVIGVLDDKIKNTKGIATKRTENTTVLQVPGKDEMRELLSEFAGDMVQAATKRQAVINESDIEVGQLPSGDDPA